MTVRDRAREPEVVVLDGAGLPGSLVGGKAAALDRLIGWSVRVPPTAVVTAAAFRRIVSAPAIRDLVRRLSGQRADATGIDATGMDATGMDATGIDATGMDATGIDATGMDATGMDATEIDATFLAAGLPDDLLDAVLAAARSVAAGRRVAVRSSATVEDLAGSSFAGQYRSVLDVDPTSRDEVARAVLAVFASLYHPAPRAYRAARGVDESSIAMAAVVMPMVDAQQAGVVFTQDPLALEPVVRVEVVDGLGDELVSGRRTPRVVRVPRSRSAEPGDGPREVELAIAAALEVERHAGVAQDVEWAWDGRELWVVQARPVTASRRSPGPPREPGDDPLDDPLDDPFDDDPASLADAELTTEGIGEMLPGVLAPLVWETASFVVEEGFRTMLGRLGADTSAAVASRWLLRRVDGRAALDVGRLGEVMARIPGADARVRAAYRLVADPERPEPGSGPVRRVARVRHARRAGAARRRAGFDAEVVVHAVIEVEAHPIEPERHTTAELLARRTALVGLAARATAAELTVSADAGAIHDAVHALLARHLPGARATVWADRVTVPDELPAPWAEASAAVFAGPTWTELGLSPVAGGRPGGPDERSLAFEELLVELDGAPGWPEPGLRRRLLRRRLAHLVDRAAAQFGRRERTKAAILAIGGEVRRIHVELVRRLVRAGSLDDPADVDLLTTAELRGLLLGLARPADLDLRRRHVWAHAARPPLPARWRGRPPTGAPRRDGRREPSTGDGRARLAGLAASGGRFTGRARRVTDPRDPIGADEVLVAEATDPSWTPVLVRCGALVIERGGPLSHAAILAREFGLPAVFDVAGAVDRLDGRRVLVDGDTGTVEVLDEPDRIDEPDGPDRRTDAGTWSR